MIRLAAFKVHQHDPLGLLIQADTRGVYTHAALEIDRGKHTIIEAYYPKVRQRDLAPNELKDENGTDLIDFYTVTGLSEQQEAAALAFANEALQHSTTYSIIDLLRFSPFLRVFIGEAKDTDPSCFCSMFFFRCMLAAGIQLLNCHAYEVDPYRLTWSTLLQKHSQ